MIDPSKHLGLVAAVAGKLVGYGDRLRDTDEFQDGCVGLMVAAKKFKPSRGTKFSTYAYCAIKSHIAQGRHKAAGRGTSPMRVLNGWLPTIQFSQLDESDTDGAFQDSLLARPQSEDPEHRSNSQREEIESLMEEAGVDEKHRRRLRLVHFSGMSAKEVAIAEGVHPVTIRYSCRVAIKKMREFVEKLEDQNERHCY